MKNESENGEQVQESILFSPIKMGAVALKHRVVMAPLTRLRSNPDNSPSDMMVEHYSQRASDGGLIIIEAASVSANGRAYQGAPGIYNDDQIGGFRKIADAIHAKGGKSFVQLFHSGRTSHVDLQPNGESPVGASVVPYGGHVFLNKEFITVSPNRALEIDEIQAIVEDFRIASERVMAAGFDGVEIHSANGYLPDQFIQDGSNKRTDAYGGPVENRARFLLEITKALVEVWGPGRVGVRISPSGFFNEVSDSNPEATFGYVATQLNNFELAYLHIIEPRVMGDLTKVENGEPVAAAYLRKIYKGNIIVAGGFTGDSAEAILRKGDADLVTFGRHFASNPDLPERLKRKLPLNPYNRDAFWGGDEHGYNDYPFYQEPVEAEQQ
jgi:N-ethylmaleimide reductase